MDASVSPFAQGLEKTTANYAALSPLSFLARAADVFPDTIAIIHGKQRTDYRSFYRRARQLASALEGLGVGKNDTVSVMLPNVPPMLEAHYGVPMSGAVLHSMNTRLDAAVIAFQLDHADCKVLITDREYAPVVKEALSLASVRPTVIDFSDPSFLRTASVSARSTTRNSCNPAIRTIAWSMPEDEWDAISLNYTSGTTGNPKGVVYHHRGAYLLGQANVIAAGMAKHPVYLWTLPMFHCNGWCFPVVAVGSRPARMCACAGSARRCGTLIADTA
jgi:fatty-acyl-CoA synthase